MVDARAPLPQGEGEGEGLGKKKRQANYIWKFLLNEIFLYITHSKSTYFYQNILFQELTFFSKSKYNIVISLSIKN